MLTFYNDQIFTDELLDKKQRLPVDKVLHFLQKQPDGNKLVITYLVSFITKIKNLHYFSCQTTDGHGVIILLEMVWITELFHGVDMVQVPLPMHGMLKN